MRNHLPSFLRHAGAALLAVAVITAAPATDAGVLNNSPAAVSPAPRLAPAAIEAPATTFLPVREAYPLAVEVQSGRILLHWHVTPGYFLYGDKFRIEATAGNTPVALQIQRDKGEEAYDDFFEKVVEKFHHDITVTTVLPADLAQTSLQLAATFQGCAEAGLCYPAETVRYRVDLTAHSATEITPGRPAVTTPAPPAPFALMFVFAIIGGLILNLMPCVFPVLSIKLLGLARSGESAQHRRIHSWCYTLGVLASFIVAALVLMALRRSGEAIGWGFQLQSPVFIAALAALFLLLGLSMSGFITLGTRLMGVGEGLTRGHHYGNSFFTGVLAVVVASPCSVPFMGVALGYALTQPPLAALAIFAGIGIGLAAPFLLFGYVPQLAQHLPKPGPWMETLKHWLALPLYLSTLWLLWVLWHQLAAPHKVPDANQPWENYSAQTLARYVDAGEPVFVDLTADWCITCLVNERTSLARPAVRAAMKQQQVHYLRGDWTNGDAEITALLKQHQRAGVPLYLYYRRDGTVEILPQLLTEQIVLDALKK